MRLAGILMLSACPAMMGMSLSAGLHRQVRWIESTLQMLHQLHDRLQYLRAPTFQLIDHLAGLEQFARLRYLSLCGRMLREGKALPQSWRGSVSACAGELGKAEAEILASLGDTLGSTDLESQLRAVQCTAGLLEERLRHARKREATRGKLYQSVGVLFGIAIAVILV